MDNILKYSKDELTNAILRCMVMPKYNVFIVICQGQKIKIHELKIEVRNRIMCMMDDMKYNRNICRFKPSLSGFEFVNGSVIRIAYDRNQMGFRVHELLMYIDILNNDDIHMNETMARWMPCLRDYEEPYEIIKKE